MRNFKRHFVSRDESTGSPRPEGQHAGETKHNTIRIWMFRSLGMIDRYACRVSGQHNVATCPWYPVRPVSSSASSEKLRTVLDRLFHDLEIPMMDTSPKRNAHSISLPVSRPLPTTANWQYHSEAMTMTVRIWAPNSSAWLREKLALSSLGVVARYYQRVSWLA